MKTVHSFFCRYKDDDAEWFLYQLGPLYRWSLVVYTEDDAWGLVVRETDWALQR